VCSLRLAVGGKQVKETLEGKRILITGGTGSLGKVLTRRILSGEVGQAAKVIILSRDEAKQHFMRLEYENRRVATEEIIYSNFKRILEFRIGDVRDIARLIPALREADIVINAAALKQVPTCEYFPYEAVRTNIGGAENIVQAIQEHHLPVETVVGVSTDKACKPVNAMGMTKALQERVFIQGNIRCPGTRFVCVRYGNVLASRGSVIPLFWDQIRSGGPVTITTEDMTRFLLSLTDAVDTVLAAIAEASPGEVYVPRVPGARITHVADAIIGNRKIQKIVSGIRPGEKVHEILISDEEAYRTVRRGRWYAILPMLPELHAEGCESSLAGLNKEYSSNDDVMSLEQTTELLRTNGLLLPESPQAEMELLR
jgi:UDP-glucose 4-epimerase